MLYAIIYKCCMHIIYVYISLYIYIYIYVVCMNINCININVCCMHEYLLQINVMQSSNLRTGALFSQMWVWENFLIKQIKEWSNMVDPGRICTRPWYMAANTQCLKLLFAGSFYPETGERIWLRHVCRRLNWVFCCREETCIRFFTTSYAKYASKYGCVLDEIRWTLFLNKTFFFVSFCVLICVMVFLCAYMSRYVLLVVDQWYSVRRNSSCILEVFRSVSGLQMWSSAFISRSLIDACNLERWAFND